MMTNKQCLIYIHEKLRVILGEHQSVEYMQQLRAIIEEMDDEAYSGLFIGDISELKGEYNGQ